MRSEWLTTVQVAEEFGVSDDTVRRWIAEQVLRATAIVVGRRVILRVRRVDLDAFRKGHVRDTTTDDWEA